MEDQQSYAGDLDKSQQETVTDISDTVNVTQAPGEMKRSGHLFLRRFLWGMTNDISVQKYQYDTDNTDDSLSDSHRKNYERTGQVALIVMTVVFIAVSILAGVELEPYLIDRAEIATRQNIARSASRGISALWNYTPDDVDTLKSRASNFLTGDMAAEYRQYIDKIADLSKQAKISNTTEVVGAAVESVQGLEATVIVYTNTETTTTDSQKAIPATRYMSYQVNMRQQGNRWLISSMPPITMLVINPRIPQAYSR